jgi:hypothetical protein
VHARRLQLRRGEKVVAGEQDARFRLAIATSTASPGSRSHSSPVMRAKRRRSPAPASP